MFASIASFRRMFSLISLLNGNLVEFILILKGWQMN